MTAAGAGQLACFAAALIALAIPLGAYIARVYTREAHLAQRVLGPVERLAYRALGIDPTREMAWTHYAAATLVFSVAGVAVVYLLQRAQGALPGNPNELGAVDPRVAFNTAVSFATNTNWQAYAGEATMSHLTQAVGLGVQNFVSAATGMAVLAALARGFQRGRSDTVGNFWVDLTRTTLYILLPLAIITALALVWQGVPQTTAGHEVAALVEHPAATQQIAVGPVASQIAIKQLGTNGGGYYNANSAHPLENPTPLASFIEMLALLLIPAALCLTFGRMVGARRQGIALLVAMALLFVPFLALTLQQEHAGNPALDAIAELDTSGGNTGGNTGGNMEGKEVRHGVTGSALWATATTAASNGAVNAMHDSFTPLGGMSAMVLMALGEVAFGGVGSGLYGLLVFAIVAVFIAGLMVGRTPELLGKKIEAHEMRMASLAILVPVAAALLGTACACLAGDPPAARGPHGFSQLLYAFLSQANNNGSAFAGLTASGTLLATAGSICMWVARFWIIIPVLAIAGSLARKQRVPASAGTLPTDGPLFVLLLVGSVLLVGALAFLPALALGPIAEHLLLHGGAP